MPRLRPFLPHALFAAVTLAVFWKFLLFGDTLHVVHLVEHHLGRTEQRPRGWFRSNVPHARVADNVSVLRSHLEVYNGGLKEGELRLWNPRLCCGYPIYSDPMVHPFYPPHLLLHAALPPDAAFEIGLMLHLFFAGAAMFWLLRGLGRGEAAAAAGGLVWMLLGYNAMWFSTGILEGVSVFGPLALLALVRGLRDKALPRAALAGGAMGLTILGSHPQHALFFFLFTAAWLLTQALRDRDGRAFLARFATFYALFAVGIGLAAILTRLETIEHGFRNPEADFATFYSRPWSLLTYIPSVVAGKAYFPDHPYFEYEFTIYAGMAALTLAIVGAIRFRRDPTALFLAAFACAALLVAFVRPLAAAHQLVPILNLSPPSRWLFVFGFCLAALAAHGLDALAAARIPRLPPALAAVTGVFVLVCLIGIGPFRLSNGAAIETALGFAIATAAAFARRPRLALGLALGAILFELLPPFVQSNWHADPAVLTETPEAVRLAASREREPWRGTGALGAPSGPEGRAFDLIDGNSVLSLYGVENVAGFEAILPEHLMSFALEAGAEPSAAGRATLFKRHGSRLLDAANLRYVFTPFPESLPARYHLVHDWGRARLYENTAALPRAYFVSRTLSARDGNHAVELSRTREFDPRTTAILEAPHQPPASVLGRVRWKERGADRLVLEVESPEKAVLVVSDTDYPGWEADVDGTPVPIYRANIAFRAVPVPAGRHEVRFRFRPDSARTGLLGSAAFTVLAAAFAFLKRKKNQA